MRTSLGLHCFRQHQPKCRPPNLPKSSRPHLPKCSQLQPPKCSQPNLPKRSLPHLPVCGPLPKSSIPHLPKSSLPHLPKCNRQHLPECRPPNLPKSSRPHLPKCIQLQPPKCSQPNQPKCSLPHLPVCSPPCLPNYKHLTESSLPHQPKCNRQHLREGRPPNPPKCSRPNPPKCTRSQLPEGSPPNVTKNSLHHLPPGSLPNHKHLPKGSLSHQPKCNRHHLPVSTPTNLPKCSRPHPPQSSQLQPPKCSLPHLPKCSLPHLPVSSPPRLPHRKHLPKCSIPHQPKSSQPQLPKCSPANLIRRCPLRQPGCSPSHLPNHNQIERRPQQMTQCNQPQNAVRKLPNQLMREQDNHDNPKWKLMDNPPNNKPAIKDTEHNSGESPTQLANLESKEKNYKRRRIRKNKELTITTINVRRIKGKIKSLESLLQAEKIDIALITETKMRKGDQISIKGYRWIEKQRTDNKGGGVGILVSEKIANNTTENNNLDDHELLESKWIRIECRPRNIAVGVFYGPQENEKVEKVKEIYNALSHQLHQIQDECDSILAGDFNAKLKISKENCEQAESRNGKILQEMITENNLTPATINADHGIWTRANRKIKNEKSVIDYIMVSPRIMSGINTVIVDEEGHLRIKGKNETDHNTLLMTMKINDTRKPKYIKKWKQGRLEGIQQKSNRKRKRPPYRTRTLRRSGKANKNPPETNNRREANQNRQSKKNQQQRNKETQGRKEKSQKKLPRSLQRPKQPKESGNQKQLYGEPEETQRSHWKWRI